MKKFTPDEDKFIIENYLDTKLSDLAVTLNRSLNSVFRRMKLLKLEIPIEIRIKRRLEAAKLNVNSGRFQPGHKPHNTGMKTKSTGRMHETQFKPGNLPPNTAPIGTEAVSGQYLKVKVDIPNVWKFKHRLVWEKHYGEIPKGMLIKFYDNNGMNCTIENLYLADRKGNMLSNTIHRYPDELKTAIKLNSKLFKTITNHEQA